MVTQAMVNLPKNIFFRVHNEIIILQEIITPANIKPNLTLPKLNADRSPS